MAEKIYLPSHELLTMKEDMEDQVLTDFGGCLPYSFGARYELYAGKFKPTPKYIPMEQ